MQFWSPCAIAAGACVTCSASASAVSVLQRPRGRRAHLNHYVAFHVQWRAGGGVALLASLDQKSGVAQWMRSRIKEGYLSVGEQLQKVRLLSLEMSLVHRENTNCQ